MPRLYPEMRIVEKMDTLISRQAIVLLSIFLLPATLAAAPETPADIRANPERMEQHIKALSAFGANADGGVDRVAFSEADLAARAYIRDLMREAGLTVRLDTAGNIIGRRGGNYDGDVGVVEGIVGIRWWDVTIEGQANHAGTTPMNRRWDAMLTAAEYILAVNRVVTSMPGGQVATVGRIHAKSGAPNVIPGEVVLSLEIRDLDAAKIQRVFDAISAEGIPIGGRYGQWRERTVEDRARD